MGGLKGWSPIGDTPVLASMKAFHFDVGGVNRSYYEFYRGFGFLLTVFLILQAALLWQLASVAKKNRSVARQLAWSIFLASIPMGVLTWIFLFPMPVYFDVLLTACLAWAMFSLMRDEQGSHGGHA
jgi:hypothetical protein